jgi:hypothetical protein
MPDHRAQLQTETTVCGQQDIAGHLGSHLAIAQDEVRQDGEYGFAGRALDAPDGNSIQADPGVMGVACQAPAATTGGLMFELKAKGYDEGEDTFEERLPIAQQLEVRRFAPEIDGDGAVCSCRLSRYAHVSPPGHQVLRN